MTHPAKFTDAILELAETILCDLRDNGEDIFTIYDPFAGTGKGVNFFRKLGYDAVGTELELEFIDSPWVRHEDAFYYMTCHDGFDVVFTSPVYGNRMADKDMRESVAGTYAKGLGRLASEGSSCHLQWGADYRAFHARAWRAVAGCLRPGGYFLLNISDHVRDKKLVPVSAWHVLEACHAGFEWIDARTVSTPRLRYGANSGARARSEWLHVFRLPAEEAQ